MSVYSERRQRFMEAMGQEIAIFSAGHERIKNADTHYRFRPNSDFYYLTGFAEPDAMLVLTPGKGDKTVHLFVRPSEREAETWTGRRAGLKGAVDTYGADAAYPITEFTSVLPSLLQGIEKVYFRLGLEPALDRQIIQTVYELRHNQRHKFITPSTFVDPSSILHAFRLVKSEDEVELIRKSCHIAARAHQMAMEVTQPGSKEYELEGVVDFCFRQEGAFGPSYPSIVATGDNATILHYTENSATLLDGQLVLIDAGCEYGFYASDITRTFPVSGKFNPWQRDLYQVVLEAQLAAIDRIRPGNTLEDAHRAACRRILEGLVHLKLVQGEVETLLEADAHKPYFMHRTSHWLGLDTHDVGLYYPDQSARKLEPGMVVTVEPGCYFRSDASLVPAPLRGIGIRIEDDCLVTEGAPDVLTAEAPKSIEAIELRVGTGKSPRSHP